MALPKFWPARTLHGGPPAVEEQVPKAAETFLRGYVVAIDGNGQLFAAVDDEAAAYGVALDDAVDGSGTLRTGVRVAVFDSQTIFAALNTGADYVKATHMGEDYELEIAGSDYGVNVGTAGANKMFTVVGIEGGEGSADGAAGSYVLVTVPPDHSQYRPFGTAAFG